MIKIKKKKTLEERLADDILTDNAALNHFSQCKDCIFRDKTSAFGKEIGYEKCVCRMYERISAARINETYPNFFSYTPIEPGDKPMEIYTNNHLKTR